MMLLPGPDCTRSRPPKINPTRATQSARTEGGGRGRSRPPLKENAPLKKLLALATILAALAAPCLLCQTDNTVIVAKFPGSTVGEKIAAAQETCGTNSAVVCLMQLDPSLAAWPSGIFPALCGHCVLVDYRNGFPVGNSPYAPVNAASMPGATASAALAGAISAACEANIKVVDARGFGGNQSTASTTIASTISLGCSGGIPLTILFDQSTHWIPGSTSTDVFWLLPGAMVSDLSVDVTTVSGYSGNGVKLCCTRYGDVPSSPPTYGARTQLNGYNFFGQGNTTATGLLLTSISSTDWIEYADFYNLNFDGGLNGVLLSASGGGGSFVNANTFYNLKDNYSGYGIKLTGTNSASVSGNLFVNDQVEAGGSTVNMLRISGGSGGSCFGNNFEGSFAWDLTAPTSSQYSVLIDAPCAQNRIVGFLGTYAGSSYPWIVTDNSTGQSNQIVDYQSGFFWGPSIQQNRETEAQFFSATTPGSGYELSGHKALIGDSTDTYLVGPTTNSSEWVQNSDASHAWENDGNGCWAVSTSDYCILPASLTGHHGGSGDNKAQMSDGTGSTGHVAIYDAGGGVTDGGQYGNLVSPTITSPALTAEGTFNTSINWIQGGVSNTGGVALGSSVTIGHTLIVTCLNCAIPPTDTAGNTFTLAATIPVIDAWNLYVFIAPITTGGADTITASNTTMTAVDEFQNIVTVSPIDASAANNTSTAGASFSAGPLTAISSDLLYSVLASTGAPTYPAPSGYTLGQQVESGAGTFSTAYAQTVPGSYSVTWNTSSESTRPATIVLLALKPGSGSPQSAPIVTYENVSTSAVASGVTALGLPFIVPVYFSVLPTCTSATFDATHVGEGTHGSVIDSTSETFGTTVSGSGSYHVSVYCNGSSWIVN